MNYIAYTDGGARGNPGPAGAGAYITDSTGKKLAAVSKYLGDTTNNVAEYSAVILALETLKKLIPKEARKQARIELRMDSELVARQMNGVYQVKEEHLFPLFMKIWNMRVADFPNLTVTHVPREKNVDADKLSNDAMDQGTGSKSKKLFE